MTNHEEESSLPRMSRGDRRKVSNLVHAFEQLDESYAHDHGAEAPPRRSFISRLAARIALAGPSPDRPQKIMSRGRIGLNH
ncbi:MAG: hypothetical protein JWO96_742 [Candidatus Saccharibacteria bacterium]|nr:hypothetical protein [Candidatus Saccharibacteria bacterium]